MLDQGKTETQQGQYETCSSMFGNWNSKSTASSGLQQVWVALSLQPTAQMTVPLDQLHSMSAPFVGRRSVFLASPLS